DNPDARIQLMIEDCQPTLILLKSTSQHHINQTQFDVLEIDRITDTVSKSPKTNPEIEILPSDPAYIIYTSGSTGKPKGVVCLHQSIANLLVDFQLRKKINTGSQASWWTNFSFDVSVYEIFSALTAGACLHIIPETVRGHAHDLFDWTEDHQINSAYFPPFFLADFLLWLNEKPKKCCLQRLLVGVEPISESLLIEIQNQVEGLQIINGYGPTEATICSTLYNINTNLIQDRITPIGQPVINSSIVLLDESNQLTPPGAIGELCIGGTGLAQDYCNNPTLTAQNFIDWSYHKNSMRIYKTGDLARYLEDGSLQFAGRVDSQIKLRGYRIELGEIETIIRQQSCIADAIVIINQHKQIVAYVLADNESNYDQTQLENTLKNHLPEYMLPTAIILMDQFPTTNNGKIDRQRLQQKELPLTSREQFIAARSAHEKLIADIWQTVLSIDPPSIHDNFFALGGDSILSIQVVAKLKTHGLILNPKQFFQSPTIAELARVIGDDVETNSAEQGVVTGKTVLHPIQHWFFNQQFKQPEHWNQSVLLKMNQPLVVQQLKHIVAQLLEHHDNLRACFQQNEATKQWSQEIKSLDNDLPLMMIDGTHWSSEELKDCLASTATIQQQALKLTDESLIQFIYFKLADELSDRLLIIAHHLIIDGVSWRILLEDCHQLINNEIQGKNLKLAEKTHSVQEWNQLLAKYSLAAECQYWKNNLSNSAITSIPKDNSTETNLEADIAIVEQKISKEQTHQLVHQANQVFFTQTSELLLAALALWQSEATNDPMLYVSVEGHGRELNKAESSSSSAQTKL
ncbi:MAG: amino acid adenylation domain-containing protein, partial [Methylococcales bacterium]|nr:amino acid adenylation domain-containing protein [Methylococcales bacterium]